VRSSGGSFIQFVPTLTADVKQATVGVTYGVVLIRFMFIMPTGVVGLVRRVAARLRGRLPPGSALSVDDTRPALDPAVARRRATQEDRWEETR